MQQYFEAPGSSKPLIRAIRRFSFLQKLLALSIAKAVAENDKKCYVQALLHDVTKAWDLINSQSEKKAVTLQKLYTAYCHLSKQTRQLPSMTWMQFGNPCWEFEALAENSDFVDFKAFADNVIEALCTFKEKYTVSQVLKHADRLRKACNFQQVLETPPGA